MKAGAALFALTALLGAPAALAQMPGLNFSGMQQGENEPATELPPLPQADGKPQQTGQGEALAQKGVKAGIPALPPARPCLKRDLLGMWKLVNLYEIPPGQESAALASSPVQYIVFDRDNTYGRLNAGNYELPPFQVRDAIRGQDTSLHQYVVNESGMVYFYQDSIAIDTLACFIVANTRMPYQVGQMLLLPPEGQAKSRLIKIYERVRRGPPQQNFRGRPSGAIYNFNNNAQ